MLARARHLTIKSIILVNIFNLIKKYEFNSRTHSENQINQIIESMKEFGFTNPILIDDNNVIIAGHARVEAAKKLQFEKIPCIILSGLTDIQKSALVIADNKIALNSGWNEDILKSQIDILKKSDFSIELLGFDNDEISNFSELFTEKNENDPDEIPEIKKDQICKVGDIWLLGDHRLICCDSTSKTEIDRLLKNEKIDLVFTDPPYELKTDDVLKCILNTDSENFLIICTFKQAAELYHFKDIIKFRFDFVLNAHVPKSFMNEKQPYYTHQNGVYFTKNEKTIFNNKNTIGIRSEKAYWCTIIDAPRNTQDKHGHAKNIKGLIDILSGFSAHTICDMFGGSGSTLLACEQTNKKCFIAEYDPKFCDLIIERWENYTGKKAIKEQTNEI